MRCSFVRFLFLCISGGAMLLVSACSSLPGGCYFAAPDYPESGTPSPCPLGEPTEEGWFWGIF